MSTQEHNYLWQAREKAGLEGRQESSFTCFIHMASLQEEILLLFVYCIKLSLKLLPDHW